MQRFWQRLPVFCFCKPLQSHNASPRSTLCFQSLQKLKDPLGTLQDLRKVRMLSICRDFICWQQLYSYIWLIMTLQFVKKNIQRLDYLFKGTVAYRSSRQKHFFTKLNIWTARGGYSRTQNSAHH